MQGQNGGRHDGCALDDPAALYTAAAGRVGFAGPDGLPLTALTAVFAISPCHNITQSIAVRLDLSGTPLCHPAICRARATAITGRLL
jgi:hypothetical protein